VCQRGGSEMPQNGVITYRELHCPDVKGLSPIQVLLNLCIVLLEPVIDSRLSSDANNVDDVHCGINGQRECPAKRSVRVLKEDLLWFEAISSRAPW
jgi:hypothetical protein